MQEETIIPIYKPIGITPLQTIDLLKKKKPFFSDKKIGYAGRLDPMAEGLLILLVGDENKKKQQYETYSKDYEFQALFGVETDTYDLLGCIISLNPSFPSNILTRLQTSIPNLLGTHEYPYPPYSSKAVLGKPLFYWARKNKLPSVIPSKKVTLYSLQFTQERKMSFNTLLNYLTPLISQVRGDFRQHKILELWNKTYIKYPHLSFSLVRGVLSCSSGTYVRTICHILGESIQTGGIAFSIKRTRVGPYDLKSALYL